MKLERKQKKALEGLYKDDTYGANVPNGSKSGGSSSKDDPQQKAFEAFHKRIEHLKAIGKLTTEQELKEWQSVQGKFSKSLELRWQVEEKIYDLQNKLLEDKQRKDQEAFSQSEKWISHKKAMGELSAAEELAAWERVQARYRVGTEERMRADEQVHTAKMALIEEEKSGIEDLISVQTDAIEKLRKDAIKKIENERDAYVEAQDAKIRAIDELIQKEQEANEDDDYEAQLAKKRARLQLLESAVGPEGIKERRHLKEEIEKMELEHQRVLRKRSLESDKKGLEDEKTEKLKAFEQDITDAENHFDDLLEAFKDYKGDIEGEAELLKNLQILKESEKNAEILRLLDAFITEYQSKMSKISDLSLTPEQKDLEEYNGNKDLWNAAKAKGDKQEMARIEARNKEIRDQYGIKQDTGKLQHFADGGVVKGPSLGQTVPVMAEVGEMYLNPSQQSNLFKLLNFRMPQLRVSKPDFAMASGSNQTIVNKHYWEISSGDTILTDNADVRTYWNERDSMVRRIQSRTGAKQR
ncbi:hypothetical protein SD71_16240 [Cohnella kolymensis]|uniref:Uncharacterized protein n=1 Tax=Cohnella kolymensis TaxID=1590652 RepID=A0ABR5A417_9BACL|nr:hypothetical protein [Cohnella kolymensis]KIL35172.1 hypothetical protein SD71_16240 [Cohnella kolymensis]